MSHCSCFGSRKNTKVKNDDDEEEEEVNKKNKQVVNKKSKSLEKIVPKESEVVNKKSEFLEKTIPEESSNEEAVNKKSESPEKIVSEEEPSNEEVVNKKSESPEKTVPKEPSSGAPKDNLNRGNNKGNLAFTYDELVTATNDFSSLIGEGGFGSVFKGKIGNQFVAVKRLNELSAQGESEFRVECHMLSILDHPNLVNLVGYCAEKDQRLLVYEYMPLNSLADYLFESAPHKEPLDWNSRMKIALGVARGLEYLHHKVDPPVIYRDLKSANILLREGFHPKLSDFGLAKFGPTGDKTHVSTRVLGTYGYCDPEYAKTGKLTLKSDIYGFGMVMLELITGRKALDDRFGGRKTWLINWILPLLKDTENLLMIVDPHLKGEYPLTSLKKALDMAFMCLREDAKNRPPMTEVVMALEYLESRKYYNPNKDTNTNMAMDWRRQKRGIFNNKKGKEREQALEEAKVWARRNKEVQIKNPSSSSSSPN